MEPYWFLLRDVVWSEWVAGLFFNGFCLHIIRPLVVALPLAIVFGQMGRGFGLPALFLRKSRRDRFFIGLGIGALIWQALVAGYFFEAFATNFTFDRPPFCEVHPQPGTKALAAEDFKNLPDSETRNRYVPNAPFSLLRYTAIIAGVAGLLLVLIRLAVALTRQKKTTKEKDKQKYEIPLPQSNWIAGGILAGLTICFALYAVYTSLPRTVKLVEQTQDFVARVGEEVVRYAGYGDASKREDEIKKFEDSVDPRTARKEKGTAIPSSIVAYYPLIGLFFVGFAFIMLFNFFVLHLLARKLSPAAGLLTILHAVLAIQTYAVYFFPSPLFWAIPLAGLVLTAAFSRYRMKFAALAPWYGSSKRIELAKHYSDLQKQPLLPPKPSSVADPNTPLHYTQIESWNRKEKKPLVFICCSGGGSRSAAWTMKILTELEKRFEAEKKIRFADHIRLVTGASGGIFGAAYYVASLPEPGKQREIGRCSPLPKAKSGKFPSLEQLNDSIRKDFLTPVVDQLVYFDLLSPFVPLPGGHRGGAIERAWKNELGGWLDLKFEDLREGERLGWRPSLAFSPMLVEDGRQLVISNLSLRKSMTNLSHKPGTVPDELLSREGLEFFPLFDGEQQKVRDSFPISTAAQMSSSFPWLFPASSLPTTPRRRVIDAGLYDNYGVGLAGSYLFTHLDWVKENASKVIVIEIRDGVSRNSREMIEPVIASDNPLTRSFEGVSTPLESLDASRSAGSTFRNDNLLHLLNKTFQQALPTVPFATTAFEFPAGFDLSMNFCLGEDEAKVFDEKEGIEHTDIEARIKKLLAWW